MAYHFSSTGTGPRSALEGPFSTSRLVRRRTGCTGPSGYLGKLNNSAHQGLSARGAGLVTPAPQWVTEATVDTGHTLEEDA